MRTFLTFAALAATTAFATPAFAQASLPSTSSDTIEATALLIQPATLQGLDNLDFGTLIASPAAAGTVSINANDVNSVRAINQTAGTLTAGAGSARRGRFVGNGLPTQNVNLEWTFPTTLVNQDDATATMPFSGSLDSNASDGTLQIGSTGVYYVYVGGTITVAPNQMPGRYTGLVEVTADFQ
ncbi:hypothetical protein GGQ97_000615 [Sphingomonas kaistensis]|uniref:DUF4402 domain-containing protein n=1 Tax=Sphingomonas kaistensis TaxID=298708 RepID=A0A7X6BGA3_9SPHN|nr:DUF4402 domain-containing protein [Sphingomonas kaistensis]NJC04822.1 hypothetical protein [Sphingomonas kaistensis]